MGTRPGDERLFEGGYYTRRVTSLTTHNLQQLAHRTHGHSLLG